MPAALAGNEFNTGFGAASGRTAHVESAYPDQPMFGSSATLHPAHNVISPHKQGSFDFSRTRLAFIRDLPD